MTNQNNKASGFFKAIMWFGGIASLGIAIAGGMVFYHTFKKPPATSSDKNDKNQVEKFDPNIGVQENKINNPVLPFDKKSNVKSSDEKLNLTLPGSASVDANSNPVEEIPAEQQKIEEKPKKKKEKPAKPKESVDKSVEDSILENNLKLSTEKKAEQHPPKSKAEDFIDFNKLQDNPQSVKHSKQNAEKSHDSDLEKMNR